MVSGLVKDNNFYPTQQEFLQILNKNSVDITNLTKAHIELFDNLENIRDEKHKLEKGERTIWFYYSDTISIYGVMIVKVGYSPIKEMILQNLYELDQSEYTDIDMYFIKSEDIFCSLHH